MVFSKYWERGIIPWQPQIAVYVLVDNFIKNQESSKHG